MASIRRQILIPMIIVTVLCGAAVLISSTILLSRELNYTMYDKLEVAANVVEQQISERKDRARIAAYGITRNPDLIRAFEENDLERLYIIADYLVYLTQAEYITVSDSNGVVIRRTHDPASGDNIAHLPHVASALRGNTEAFIFRGPVVRLGISSGTPILSDDDTLLGVVSIGFRLDTSDFPEDLKALTGCDIGFYVDDERISSSELNGNGNFALGSEAPGGIAEQLVVTGEPYIVRENLQNRNALMKFLPIFDYSAEVVGMISVVYYTADDTARIFNLAVIGVLITFAVLLVCIVISGITSGAISNRLNDMMSQLEKSQEDLRQARDVAEAANKTKSSFLANMSHEIRTPMNSIIGFSELAQKEDISEKTRDYLSNILSSAEWLLKIINDILDISKIESGKIELEKIPFAVQDIISHCQASFKKEADERGIMLYCYVESSIGKRLLGDPFRLRQVIMNLVSNAVKFTSMGIVKVLVSAIEVGENSISLHFEIRDSGIGMTKEQVEKILDPFEQANDSVTRKYGGTGLGVPIAKNIIDLMGGELKIESAPGVGSNFSFDLTLETVDVDIDAVVCDSLFDTTKTPTFVGDIMVCEDNHLNRQLIDDHLRRVGLDPLIVNDGKKGIDTLAKRQRNNQKPFDLILMDIHMPVMDGLEAASRIIEMGITTPVVALTANVMSNDLDTYAKCGITDAIGKPYTTKELWTCLAKYLTVKSESMVDLTQEEADICSDLDTGSANPALIDDEYIERRLKRGFYNSHKETVSELKAALGQGDVGVAHRQLHALKGIAGQLGEKRLQEIAGVAEKMLSDGVNNLDNDQIQNIDAALTAVLDKYAKELDNDLDNH